MLSSGATRQVLFLCSKVYGFYYLVFVFIYVNIFMTNPEQKGRDIYQDELF